MITTDETISREFIRIRRFLLLEFFFISIFFVMTIFAIGEAISRVKVLDEKIDRVIEQQEKFDGNNLPKR